MFQTDLFSLTPIGPKPEISRSRGIPGILECLTAVCERPRYSFMVLNLIAQASAGTGSAGPHVLKDGKRIPVREWLCEALGPVTRRDPNHDRIIERVRRELTAAQELPQDSVEAEILIAAHVCRRVRASGLTNVSRAVSELVRAGLVRRHYQGFRVDHRNRGGQRLAVYTVTAETLKALGLHCMR